MALQFADGKSEGRKPVIPEGSDETLKRRQNSKRLINATRLLPAQK